MNRTFRSVVLILLVACTASAADLQPFRMAWDGADKNATSLHGWQDRPAGADGWVAVSPDAHYTLNGQRLRFLGINIGAGSAFPTKERADGHAARLARFGYNAVRFHHLEAPWEKNNVLIDYSKGTSRELSADRLDKLHYFVAKLAEHGIYSNINLLVSREFQANDGLGEDVAKMGWKDQHILAFFNDMGLVLHQEHARNLLTAPNPYRDNIPLAQDPAVAFVEIMNENGLLQKWHEGVLDSMPQIYRTQLGEKWNQWLTAKYGATSAMLTAWGAVDEPFGPNLLVNGDFSSSAGSWTVERHQSAQASVSTPNDFNGKPALKVEVTTPSTASWHVQVNQSRLNVEPGKLYTLSFWAKASVPTPMSASLQRAHTDWATLAPGISANLTSEWREFSITFPGTVSESNARINFNGFGDLRTTVWIADVRFQNGGKIGALPDGASLESANVPNVARGGSGATLAQRRDWVQFALDREAAYWREMNRYIKENLAYPGIVWGTIISNSPANAQGMLDAIDSHSYWQHPSFPSGQDWSAENWTIQNISMVNDDKTGVIAGIARQRVKGKPHNVTEYQHPSPNTYSTEGPILSAAYGALQDWDSIWHFAYETVTAEFTTGFFDHGGNPGKMANNLLAATIFRRGDVAPAVNEYAMKWTPEIETTMAAERGSAWAIADGGHIPVPHTLALVSRVSLAISESAEGLEEPPAAPEGPVYDSDTGELRWDLGWRGKGVVTVNTPRTKAVVGFKGDRTFDLGGVVIQPGETRQDWSTVGIALLEGDKFDAAAGGHAIIVATGDNENSGQVWKDASKTSIGSRWGGAPALIEVIPATFTLPVAASRVKVWALDERGERMSELAVSDVEGKAQFAIGNNGITLWYEVAIEPEAPINKEAPGEIVAPAVTPRETRD